MRLRLLLPCLLLLAGPGWAQSIRWQPGGGALARGQVTDLVLIFDNCEPSGEITLPDVPGLEIGSPQRGEQTSMNIINGRTQRNRLIYFSYPVRPAQDAPITVPAFSVATDEGTLPVPSVRFEVREATVGDTSIPVSQVAHSSLSVGQGQLWAGEVVPVDYTLSVSARFRANLGGGPDWAPAPLVVEEWAEPTRHSEGTGADARNLLTYSTRGYITTPGTHTLPSVQQLVNIGVPSAGFLQSLRAEQYAITSESPQVVVRPLPSPAPDAFSGAVGNFTFTSRVVPEQAGVGEPVTWTLTLNGTGNWPAITGLPARQVSRSFRVVQPQANRDTVEGKLFEGSITEDVVLIPTQAGRFTLGPVNWTYFDPRAGTYRTLTAPETVLTIDAAPPPAAGLTSPDPTQPYPGGAAAGVPDSGPEPIRATPAPAAPSALPRDPLAGDVRAAVPWATGTVIGVGGGIVALLPLLWLTLSWRHAVRHDPGRPAREARRRLVAHLAALRTAGSVAARDTRLLQWQQDTARLWRTPHAAPSAGLFNGDRDWTRLWRDCERALYGPEPALPADWFDRATAALAAKRAPRFPMLSILSPRNLLPVLLVLGLMTMVPTLEAEDAIDAYARGDFAAAAETWQSAIKAAPTDWIAHHNLALAFAQQGFWDRAGAHAAVAFVQNPRHPSVRWHLNYTLERSGYTPPVLGAFIAPGWAEKLAWQASPAQWQHGLLLGLLLGVVALALVLGHAYGLKLRPWKALAWMIGLIGVGGMIAAAISLQTYGLTADARAVLTWRSSQLRSIPTDLDGEQQTTTLAAGSLARVEKSFLGWRQLSFPNGQTGWVRHEELVPLWRSD